MSPRPLAVGLCAACFLAAIALLPSHSTQEPQDSQKFVTYAPTRVAFAAPPLIGRPRPAVAPLRPASPPFAGFSLSMTGRKEPIAPFAVPRDQPDSPSEDTFTPTIFGRTRTFVPSRPSGGAMRVFPQTTPTPVPEPEPFDDVDQPPSRWLETLLSPPAWHSLDTSKDETAPETEAPESTPAPTPTVDLLSVFKDENSFDPLMALDEGDEHFEPRTTDDDDAGDDDESKDTPDDEDKPGNGADEGKRDASNVVVELPTVTYHFPETPEKPQQQIENEPQSDINGADNDQTTTTTATETTTTTTAVQEPSTSSASRLDEARKKSLLTQLSVLYTWPFILSEAVLTGLTALAAMIAFRRQRPSSMIPLLNNNNPAPTPIFKGNAAVSAVVVWGVLGVTWSLARAVLRLLPFAVHPIVYPDSLTAVQWALYVACVLSLGYFEGYKAFHLRLCPMVVQRALTLGPGSPWWHVIMAPQYCMGLFHATKKRKIVAWSFVFGIATLIAVVNRLPFVWRVIIDAGAAVGLSIGVLSLVYHFARYVITGKAPGVDPQLPENENRPIVSNV